MTVYDFVGLITDPSFQTIHVYDIGEQKTIYHGSANMIPARIENMTVESIDTLFDKTDVLTINVDWEEP